MENGESLINDSKTVHVRELKICRKCLLSKPKTEFHKARTNVGRFMHWCKTCWNKRANQHKINLRQTVLKILCPNGVKCQCCCEYRDEFMTIDHIKGRKKVSDTGSNLYTRLIALHKLGIPLETDYRVLCMNCNLSYGRRGYCPHEVERKNCLQVA